MPKWWAYGDSESCRASDGGPASQEAAMYSHFTALLAAEHVNDMQAQATAARRARQARRARRGRIMLATATHTPQPCPEFPCPPLGAPSRQLMQRAA